MDSPELLLRKLEWCGPPVELMRRGGFVNDCYRQERGEGMRTCPICGGIQPDNGVATELVGNLWQIGHYEGCELAVLLYEAK